MNFKFLSNSHLSKLAWLAEVNTGEDEVKVWLGDAVERTENFFVAGVWDGNFIDGDFSNAHFSCSTGGILINPDSVKFSTPNHTQEFLYSITLQNVLYISNSAAFLLAKSGQVLDIDYYQYEEDFSSGLYGLGNCTKGTFLKNNIKMHFHRCCNVIIDRNLHITEENKRSNLKFKDFQDYKKQLLSILEELRLNSIDCNRINNYGLISTISKGYDATATSALVIDIGCTTAFTFNRPGQYVKDCGADIAKQLGYENIILADADLYKCNDRYLEAEACCSGEMGVGIIFSAHEDSYRNKLLFLGERGDSIWAKKHSNINCDYDFSLGNKLIESDLSFKESFLRTNTIMINLPLIGGDSWSDIYMISNSEEMKPYSIGGIYDRPIPRRILEEKGVDRYCFGQMKLGAGLSFHFDTLRRLKYRMSPNSYRSLISFSHNIKRNIYINVKHKILFYAYEYPSYVNYIFSKLGFKFRLNSDRCGKKSSPISSLLILWGMDIMVKRYKEAIDKQ